MRSHLHECGDGFGPEGRFFVREGEPKRTAKGRIIGGPVQLHWPPIAVMTTSSMTCCLQPRHLGAVRREWQRRHCFNCHECGDGFGPEGRFFVREGEPKRTAKGRIIGDEYLHISHR
jgi:hypothetical protein